MCILGFFVIAAPLISHLRQGADRSPQNSVPKAMGFWGGGLSVQNQSHEGLFPGKGNNDLCGFFIG